MNPVSRAVGAGGGRWLVGLALAEVAAGRALTNVLRVAAYVTVPGVVLVAGGYRLPTTQISPRYFPAVGGWCLAGVAVMLASLALYRLEPAESVTDPARGALVLSGVRQRRRLRRGQPRRPREDAGAGAPARNGELERTEARLAETVERLEAANDALAASNDRLDEFASVVSHDLQEPLRTVSNYLALLEDRHGDDLSGDAREFLDYAVDGAERMHAMVDGLLELSRVETRGDDLEPVDLDEVLRDVRWVLDLRVAETDATVEVEDLPEVVGDLDQLGQLFQNLLSNALQYSGDDPPRVTVTSDEVDEHWATVSVREEGIGIDPENLDRIFGAFQRLHSRER